MPRPKAKDELLAAALAGYEKLMGLIDSLVQPESLVFPEGTMNRNIRDCIVHLEVWHRMLLRWESEGKEGGKPAIPAEGYTWKTTPALNRKIWEEALEVSLSESLERFAKRHREVMDVMRSYDADILFEKKHYKWTGSTSVGAYMVSATSSHYEWAVKLIRKAIKAAG